MMKWPNSYSRLLYRLSVFSSLKEMCSGYDIVNPLSKIKRAIIQDVFFRWLRVFYLLELAVDGME